MSALSRAVADALALALPVECSGCGAGGRSVCGSCLRGFGAPPPLRELDGVPVASAVAYAGEVARIIGAFKDAGRVDAARALGPRLREAAIRVLDETAPRGGGDVLAVPIPGTRSAFRRRGYDPVRVLARAGSLPTHRLIRPARRVADQAELDASQRWANRAGALVARRDLTGASVLLLDDVITTGATLNDAIRAVREAGGTVIGAATVAATPRRRTSA